MVDFEKFIETHIEETKDLLRTLAKIPAPSHHEEKRAEFVKTWLEGQGAKGVYIDEALNVIYPIKCEESDDITVFMAHTDVVFPDTEELPFKEENGRYYAPGVGDDTACLVLMLMVTKYIIENDIKPRNGILIIANACEEGLGNLKGSKTVIQSFKGRIKEFYTFDGNYNHVVDRAVGSHRYEVVCETEGGHSYGNFGNSNAIAELASLITELYKVEVPKKEGTKTTYNVGAIEGGTSVNTIAQSAKMLYEYRSDDAECIAIMKNTFESLVEKANSRGNGKFSVNVVGIRPCGEGVDPEVHERMLSTSSAIIEKYTGQPCVRQSGSTDANSALAEGIPAVCVGSVWGLGAHTREEYVELDSLPIGMRITHDIMMQYFK